MKKMREGGLTTFKGKNPSKGFTLVELMVTVVIASILLAIGLPQMRDFVSQNRLTSHVNEFVAANMMARSEAINRGVPVRVCRSVNADTGSNNCVAGGSWETGWLIMVPNTDPAKVVILGRKGALPTGTTVTAGADTVTYNSVGQPVLAAGSSTTSFVFSNDCRLSQRSVEIGRTGRTTVTKMAAAGCP